MCDTSEFMLNCVKTNYNKKSLIKNTNDGN